MKSSPTNPNSGIAAVVLAAGASTRLKTPKQLVLHQGESLLRRTVRVILAIKPRRVVVLGAYAERVIDQLDQLPVKVVQNREWQEGMGSSIRAGLAALSLGELRNGVLVTVCDQPLLSASHLDRMYRAFCESMPEIVASSYDRVLGVPAIFRSDLITKLTTLSGEEGARKIIADHYSGTIGIDFPEGRFDIDSPDDLKKLIALEQAQSWTPHLKGLKA
jgi:molybdenum cofactor cytidylyltransferase